MPITDNLSFSESPQTAFTDILIDHMMLPTAPSKNKDGQPVPPESRLVRWILNTPLFLAKGDSYSLPTLRIAERALIPKLALDGEAVLSPNGTPLLIPAGPPVLIEFGFTIKKAGQAKTHTHWRYGKMETARQT